MTMPFEYIVSPQTIEAESFVQIRELTNLNGLSREQQQVVMRVVHSVGIPEVAAQVRFSNNACESGIAALKADAEEADRTRLEEEKEEWKQATDAALNEDGEEEQQEEQEEEEDEEEGSWWDAVSRED